jgi:PhzF family phenazine biosynthesis protein
MSLPYHILDVFTETPFLGNPLVIVTIPPDVTLATAQKQAIAREFNLSETVFIHDSDARN